jgi:hypothetical protein
VDAGVDHQDLRVGIAPERRCAIAGDGIVFFRGFFGERNGSPAERAVTADAGG